MIVLENNLNITKRIYISICFCYRIANIIHPFLTLSLINHSLRFCFTSHVIPNRSYQTLSRNHPGSCFAKSCTFLDLCVPVVSDVGRSFLCVDLHDPGRDCGEVHCCVQAPPVQDYLTGAISFLGTEILYITQFFIMSQT